MQALLLGKIDSLTKRPITMTIVTIQQQCLLRTRENNRWSKNNFGEIHTP